MKEQTLDAWHFAGPILQDGTLLPEDGETLRIDGEPVLCAHGYHASVRALDALAYTTGATLCRVRLSGQIIEDRDKAVATERTILWRVDGEALLRRFARWCALDVIELWEAPDVVREYLRTGREDLRAAAMDAIIAAAGRIGTYDAATDAAWHATWGDAENAASAAAIDAAKAAASADAWGAAEGAAARAAASAAASATAWHAAWGAAEDAARAAAWDAAEDGARAAARTRQENRLRAMIHAERRRTG